MRSRSVPSSGGSAWGREITGFSRTPGIMEASMPEYSYQCEACGKNFTKTIGILKHETAKVACPECSSRKVRQKISSFSAITKKKS
jgi:putative FmdB family regulatory protein